MMTGTGKSATLAVFSCWLAVTVLLGVPRPAHAVAVRPVVVLLHGLARSTDSMEAMAAALQQQGFRVCNLDYPSRHFTVEILASTYVLPAIQRCLGADKNQPVNFVTHSLGGILVRQLRTSKAPILFGRVVMLGPPNEGSQVVDKLGDWWLFRWWNGPAAQELGTGAPLLTVLGPTDLDVGIIAGNHTINPFLSLLIKGDDDGKVSIDNTRLAGMHDFLVVPVSHPFLMKDETVIEQTIQYLRQGKFRHAG